MLIFRKSLFLVIFVLYYLTVVLKTRQYGNPATLIAMTAPLVPGKYKIAAADITAHPPITANGVSNARFFHPKKLSLATGVIRNRTRQIW